MYTLQKRRKRKRGKARRHEASIVRGARNGTRLEDTTRGLRTTTAEWSHSTGTLSSA